MLLSVQDKSNRLGQQLVLSSLAFEDGEDLPRIYTADGSDLSPPLHWHGIPANTGSFTLFFEDLDVGQNRWVHWLLFDIPANLLGLPAGIQSEPCLANGSRHGVCQAASSSSRLGYQGPTLSAPQFAPTPEDPEPRHRLRFTLIALDNTLALPAGSPPERVRQELKGHQLSVAHLFCLYGQKSRQSICK